MLNQQLIKNASQAYVMSQYLADLCQKIGKDAYLSSPIRLEHGTGTGFFGVGNTGSTDCVKERFRGITDNLGQRYSCWQKIDFVSQSCLNLTYPDFRTTHRVEHTREVIDLYRQFEKDYIIEGKPFTAADLAVWVIVNQVVCLIEQTEQKSQDQYDDQQPFSKYSSPICYKGYDISAATRDELIEINKIRFASVIESLRNHDFAKINKHHETTLLNTSKKHTLPPMDIAVKYHDDVFELLEAHYTHKLNKRTNPADKKWYSEQDTEKYNNWKKAKQNETLSME